MLTLDELNKLSPATLVALQKALAKLKQTAQIMDGPDTDYMYLLTMESKVRVTLGNQDILDDSYNIYYKEA